MIGLFWHMPNGNYLPVDEVLKYRHDGMAIVLSAGDRLLVRQENLVAF
jgi:hypothetical protein